jgi:hypothetical protein
MKPAALMLALALIVLPCQAAQLTGRVVKV